MHTIFTKSSTMDKENKCTQYLKSSVQYSISSVGLIVNIWLSQGQDLYVYHHLELKYSAIIWHTEIITALTIVMQTHMKHLKYWSALFSYECQMHSIKNTKIPQQIRIWGAQH